jgi:hypothetical protein
MENVREQLKDFEINNLRFLNNCLTQTIGVLSQKYGSFGSGLSHSPYQGMPCPNYNYMAPIGVPGMENYWTGGLSHSPYSVPQGSFGMPVPPVYPPAYPYYVDAFGSQIPRTGLSHTPGPVGWQPWQVYAMEQVRQQQLAQAFAARQGIDPYCRGIYG